VAILRHHLPALKIRFINVVDLMKLPPASGHPHGLSDADFDLPFTKERPIIFAYHCYPWLIPPPHLPQDEPSHLHVRGYKEEGTITTPFDMAVLNDLDRFHPAGDAIDRLPQLGAGAAYVKQWLAAQLFEHRHYIRRYGQDMLSIREWRWPSRCASRSALDGLAFHASREEANASYAFVLNRRAHVAMPEPSSRSEAGSGTGDVPGLSAARPSALVRRILGVSGVSVTVNV
jgi:hypothetical protein